MKVTMRLYRLHDMDLLYLYKIPGFSLPMAVKDALGAFVNKTPLSIEYPDTGPVQAEIPKSVQFHICLSEKNDGETIAWLKTVTRGFRNSLLKNILRNYLFQPSFYPYIGGGPCFVDSPKQHPLKTHSPAPMAATAVSPPPMADSERKKLVAIELPEDTEKTDGDFNLFAEFDNMMGSLSE